MGEAEDTCEIVAVSCGVGVGGGGPPEEVNAVRHVSGLNDWVELLRGDVRGELVLRGDLRGECCESKSDLEPKILQTSLPCL